MADALRDAPAGPSRNHPIGVRPARGRCDARPASPGAQDDEGEATCVRVDLARALCRLGRVEAAGKQVMLAAKRLRELGAEVVAERAERVLDSDPGAATPTQPGIGGLSQREVEVLGLLVEGLSDRELAERLCISAPTVHRLWVPEPYPQTLTCGFASVAEVRDDRQSWRCDCST